MLSATYLLDVEPGKERFLARTMGNLSGIRCIGIGLHQLTATVDLTIRSDVELMNAVLRNLQYVKSVTTLL